MVTLPKNIDEWTIGTITDILHSGQYETDVIEFKEDIMSENERIARTCCAFTNTNGGLMIFGISDDRSKPSLQRITGLNRSEDNITKITSQIKNITPQIELQNIVFSKHPI